MKSCLIIFMNIFFVSCNNELKYGYVYDIKMNVPIENVKVFDADNNITSYTNKDGYFELSYTQNYPSKLIFSAKNYKIDTLPSFGCSNSGETSNKCFRGQRIYLYPQK
ncbi:hypothetical protein [Flavobacterium johnsoniae]|uniref:hypothetical protein n=1 Tax=Flavobacterium johnsoniae TaxID=986 RepID=UPI003D95DD35